VRKRRQDAGGGEECVSTERRFGLAARGSLAHSGSMGANGQPPRQKSSSPPHLHRTATSLLCRNRTLRFARSQTVALRMSTVHVLAFVGCWTPYLIISAWHIVDPDGVSEDVPAGVQDALFLTAVFNSCLNPLVYGGFYFRYVKHECRALSSSRSE